jgi:APA family basic amino acid/polyamine antiporter
MFASSGVPDRGNVPTLVRVMGRWTVIALVINAIIGSGIFGLPSVVAGHLGPASRWAWIIGAGINAVIVLCFVEVASRFSDAGGAYLYARRALPRLPAILVGWLTYLTRLSAVAAGANLLAVNLAEFIPGVDQNPVRGAVLTVMLASFAIVNYLGAQGGARLSSFFTVAKLIPLVVLVVAGIAFLLSRGPLTSTVPTPTSGNWPQALILIGFAYGGFDGAMLALGEARDPRRDAPRALIVAMLFLALLYTVIQVIVDAALPDPAATSRPLAEAARVFMGDTGAVLLAAGAVISLTGFLSANFLNGPRLTFALAEHHDAPGVLGRVHATFRTPYVSILLFTGLIWGLTVLGSFEGNASLSGVARLFVYASTCVSLLVLRRTDPAGAAVPIRGGAALAFVGVGLCALLAASMGEAELKVLSIVMVLGVLHWLAVRRNRSSSVDVL